MNPPATRGNGRFIRGRGRGGGAYRPYFYFRRNGRTIPAGGHGDANVGGCGRQRRRGQQNNGILQLSNMAADSSFLRPECYSAPIDAKQTVQSVTVDMPLQCPGWHLYFQEEKYSETSDLAKRIEVIGQHYINNAGVYNLKQIQLEKCFKLEASLVCGDNLLTNVWPNVKTDMLERTQSTLATFGAAMHKVVTLDAIDSSQSQEKSTKDCYVPRCTLPRKIFVRPEGFSELHIMSQIDRSMVDIMCSVRGSVSAIGTVEAMATWIAYKCSRCGQEQTQRQKGYSVIRPQKCKKEGCLAKKKFIEQRSSPFTRITPTQIVQIQESNIQAPIDLDFETSAFLDIELKYDLVDTLVCGQDVIINGIIKLRTLDADQNTYPSTSESTSKIYMKAVSIGDAKDLRHNFTQRDMDAIAMINSEPDSFKLLSHSVAPELHGEELVKAGVLLSLFGGAGSQIHEESEINVLLVGDPGIGKSHLLEMAAKVSQKGTIVSGKHRSPTTQTLASAFHGSTNHILSSGALANANAGHCAIDDLDRLASEQGPLMQIMQSKMVSLPFPNLCSTITMPTSVIAAANSLHGHYDHSRLLTENTRLSTTLLQQFNLVFLLLDKSNKDLDTSLTEHIRSVHDGVKKNTAIALRFEVKPKSNNSISNIIDEDELDDEHYDLSNRLKLKNLNYKEEELDLLPPILLKKFIAYARQHVRPLLNDEAAEMIKSFYMGLREKEGDEQTCAVNVSHLEGLIRLSQARARIDFSAEVTKLHVRDVLCIVRHSIADTALNDYIDRNPATASANQPTSQRGLAKKFIQMLQARSNALGRRLFDYDELKDMATRAGITCGVSNLVESVNLQGYLLKKGVNMYEVMTD